MITIVDYGLGNPPSVRNMLRKAGHDAAISADAAVLRGASKLILPGVGAFDHGMQNLEDRGLLPVLNDAALERRIPVLGICLGMQLMSRRSEEGVKAGLGWLDADTVRFNLDSALRVPHMGWNAVTPTRDSFLTRALPAEARYYFVHSYHVRFEVPSEITMVADYGGAIAAAAIKGNIAGTQFHPEKSHRFGLALLKAFAEWDGRDA